jgi:2-oxoglutarate dehydrogenase E1 component
MKRFGLEGCESFIPGMKSAMDSIQAKGAKKAIIGMPHRGRLNVLANVVRKPLEQLFAEFIGTVPIEDKVANWQAHTGDAKYHLGTNYTKTYPNGQQLTVEVLANPSHLECINPVVMGRCRAENHSRSERSDDESKDRDVIVPFLIHGDAAFAGQGVVYESMQMQDLKNYTVGGTIHVIVNNQIGFTTVPSKGRSGMYSSDLAKSINAPIFHVNADYRQKYNHDVVIDLIGYRKFGHNELDQPSFTQPMMYKRIAEMTPVARIYE